MKKNKFQLQLDREKMVVIDELLSQKKKSFNMGNLKDSTFSNANASQSKSTIKDGEGFTSTIQNLRGKNNRSDGNIYIKNEANQSTTGNQFFQGSKQESSFQGKLNKNIKKIERLEKKYESDEFFLNQTIKKKKKELEKVQRVQSQQQMMNYFKLSDAKTDIPHLMSSALDNSDQSIRQKIREFLGTNFKTDFFDNLDDFVGCVKILYGNSKLISAKIDRIFQGKKLDDFDDMEKLQMKFADELRSRPIRLREQERLQKMKQQGGFDGNKPPSVNNFLGRKSIDTNFYSTKNRSNGLPSLANFDMQSTANINSNYQKTILLDTPALANLQSRRFELGDVDTFTKTAQRKNQIGAMYKNSQNLFIQAQVEMLDKEEKLAEQCEDFKKLSQQLVEYRKTFRDNLQTLNIIKKLKANKQEFNQDEQEPEQKKVKFQSDIILHDQVDEIRSMIVKQDNSQILKELFRRSIWSVIYKLKRLKLEFDEIFENEVFPNAPFERQGSQEFFKAVKSNDLEKARKMLQFCKYHVYDFDSTRQTALHWAARRNLFDMMALVCEYGADLEAQDMGGRTPLFLCVNGGYINACRMILARGANPYVKSLAKNKPADYTDNEVVKNLLRKAEQTFLKFQLQIQASYYDESPSYQKKKRFLDKKCIGVFAPQF